MKFVDRQHAGRLLAERIVGLEMNEPLVLALPRGGVPVAYEIAHATGAPLDVLIVRKVGAPGYEEFGIGAITENNHYWIDPAAMNRFSSRAVDIDRTLDRERAEVQRRIDIYRGHRPLPALRGRSVIVVDDGLATGVTARVACAYLRQQGAGEVILAVPVCSPRTSELLRDEVDQFICLQEPESFFAVGQFYERFHQLEDHEVLSLLHMARSEGTVSVTDVAIEEQGLTLGAQLAVPAGSKGTVIFAHGSGSSRFSPRNQQVAKALQAEGLATLLFDLLTPEEAGRRQNIFDIPLLGSRLLLATRWLTKQNLPGPVGFFGASTGGGAALWAAAEIGSTVAAVVSRGGRPDLAGERLKDLVVPTLLIVGGRDGPVIQLNRQVLPLLKNAKLEIIPGATHLFEEPGAMEQVESLAAEWFLDHFEGGRRAAA
jgi:predicted phosphoribosyltransferase/dienelactone hydrolase